MILLLLQLLQPITGDPQPADSVNVMVASSGRSSVLGWPERGLPTPIGLARGDAQEAMVLGDSLLRHRFFFQAEDEFRRSLWLGDPDRATAGEAHLKLGLSLAARGELYDAAEELHEAGRVSPDFAEPAQTALAGLYARRQRFDLAEFELSDLLVFTRDSGRRAGLNSHLGWLRLQEGDLSSAAASYDLGARPDIANILRRAPPTRRRDPALAAVLSSIVPGSGEAYAGRPASGLLAFAVTAAAVAWTVVAAKSDDWVSASVILSTLFWRFYNGSRANALAFADEFNTRARRQRIAEIRTHIPEPGWYGGVDSVLGYEVRPDTAAIDSVAGLRKD